MSFVLNDNRTTFTNINMVQIIAVVAISFLILFGNIQCEGLVVKVKKIENKIKVIIKHEREKQKK